MHLAQLNIARLRYPIDDPRVADFVDNLDRVNGLAEKMPGFVWRLTDDSGNATSIQAFADPALIVNMSVWETADALERFVWQTIHRRFYSRRAEWFEATDEPYLAIWWVEPGDRPTLVEARERLAHLRKHGPTAFAFGWESVPQAAMWKTAQCA